LRSCLPALLSAGWPSSGNRSCGRLASLLGLAASVLGWREENWYEQVR
jgi:hypothetical protein